MTATQQKPTVLFTHGSWHQPSHFDSVREVFEAAGYPTSCPRLPSFAAAPDIGLMEDAQCIRDELSTLIDKQGKDVILIGHSYGGVVNTQAANDTFAKKAREALGQSGGIVRLMYICAFVLPPNLSLAGALGGSLPPYIEEDKTNKMCMMLDPADRFYHDLTPEDQQKYISQLAPCPVITQFTAITETAYLYHPLTYLFCQNDHALPFEVQQMMVDNTEKNAGVSFVKEYCHSSHSPFLSMPGKVLEVVQRMEL